ncbi:MAG: thiamine phosphate synthase [Candidatus Omnitrophota bacterium]|nr:thiamine phosphate synthase [Candidatus Omnitrophota bacterium]
MAKIKDHSLYLIISEEFGKERSALEIAKLAIAGGVDIIQMREKNKPANELLKLGRDLSGLCAKSNVIFMINDNPSIAKKAGADGVHLGQEDMSIYPIAMARSIMGEDKIIGISTHSLSQFEKAGEEDVDYIAFGPVFPTKTKDYFIGIRDVKKVLGNAKKPVFFIGGINLINIDELLGMGAENIALIRGITETDEIVSKTRQFKNRITGFKRGG